MAQILVNGGQGRTVRLVPTALPKLVKAYRELEDIRRRLTHFQEEFACSSTTNDGLRPILARSRELNEAYLSTLKTCREALSSDIDGMSQEARAYYQPVLTFLERADNAHTILPFETYLHTYSMWVGRKGGYEGVFPEIPTLTHLRAFIEDRIAESIITCGAYCILLSNSLGAQARYFPLDEMLFKIAQLQREVSIQNRAENVKRTEDRARLREQHKKGVILNLELAGQVFAIPELTYFLFQQVVSNSFKGSFGAYYLQRGDPTKPIAAGYENMAALEEPRVEITLTRQDMEWVKVVVTDNGMGVPQNMLARLVATTDEERLRCFRGIQASNGSSTGLFPFLVDLMRLEMFMQSDGVGKGFRTEILLPVNMNMRPSV